MYLLHIITSKLSIKSNTHGDNQKNVRIIGSSSNIKSSDRKSSYRKLSYRKYFDYEYASMMEQQSTHHNVITHNFFT